MLLCLIQHGEAKREDSTRSLTEKGIQDITKVATFLASLDIKINKISTAVKKGLQRLQRSCRSSKIRCDLSDRWTCTF